MLGATREEKDAAERRRLWRDLLVIAMPPSLIRFRLDVAQAEMDRLVAGPEPQPSRWNPYRGRERLAWMMWRVLLAIQAQRRRLTVGVACAG